MNIKEVEKLTGITKQNIRFYEKKGLLAPQRNEENSYRTYSSEDVEILMQIKLLRKLDVSIEHIHEIQEGADMNAILSQHLELLLEKQSDLNDIIKMCRFLLHSKKNPPDTRSALQKIEDMERKGGRFMAILNDYKKVSKTEVKQKFSFSPDTLVMNEKEFTEALYAYGRKNDLNLTITKEGMYPIFEIDGLEYEAHREFGRYFRAIICCRLTHPELLQQEYQNVEEKRGRFFRKIHWGIHYGALPVLTFLFVLFIGQNLLLAFLFSLVELFCGQLVRRQSFPLE